MVRWVATVLAVALVLGTGPAEARRQRIQRFHPLSEHFVKHLEPAARRNVNAVVRYGYGLASGVLVAGRPGQTKTGLVLTSEHVFRKSASLAIEFADGKESVIKRVIASSKKLDYALLEVELPPDTAATPASLRGRPVHGGEAIYSVSATTNPKALRSRLKTTTAQWRNYAGLLDRGFLRTIQRGHETSLGVLTPVAIEGQRHKVISLLFKMPNAPGMSGSPIFSSATHEVIALHWGGNHIPRKWGAAGVPARGILLDLALRARNGRIPADAAAPVIELLQGAAR